MAKYKVFVTRKIPDDGLKLLKKKRYELIVMSQETPLSRYKLLKGVKDADAVISLLTDEMDEEVFSIAKNLKIVANYAVGFNNIDLEAAKKYNIMVTNTPHPWISESVAEHTIGLMIALAHRIVEGDYYVRKGKYKGWHPMLMLGEDLVGKKVGIIGLGRIGTQVVHRLVNGFNVEILYYDKHKHRDLEKKYGIKHVQLKTLLKNSDFVSLHVPLTKETHHLIGMKELRLMKKTAFLINTSRGPVVDEKALVAVLKKNKIAGAGLDVFENEPKLEPGLKDLPNVVLTPHIASANLKVRKAMSITAAQNVIAALSGQKPPNLVV